MRDEDKPTTNGPCDTLVTFTIGPFCLCGPVMPVLGIITPPAITRLPLSKPTAAGVFRYQGRTALAFDLHLRLGLPTRRDTGDGLLIVTDIEPGTVAFWVDQVLDVPSASAFSWRATPSALEDGVVESFACSADSMFLFATYERLFRGEAKTLINAGRLGAPAQQGVTGAIIPTGCEPLALSEQMAELVAQDDRLDVLEVVTHDRPSVLMAERRPLNLRPSLRAVTQTRPASRAQGLPVAPLSRPFAAQSRHTPTPANPTHSFDPIPSTMDQEFVQERALPANHRNWRIAASILILPLLGTVTYWLWPGNTRHTASVEAVSSPLSSSTVAIVSTYEPPREVALPATTATKESDHTATDQPLVATDEFVITIESPAQATRSELASSQADTAVGQWEQITHTVRRGDTLWAISQRYLGNPFRYPELARLSTISNPHRIYPGDVVRIKRMTRARPTQHRT